MNDRFKSAILTAFEDLPIGCRYPPATPDSILAFEREFGRIPVDYAWFLTTCGGGVCGSEWLDGIEQLPDTHRKFAKEKLSHHWTMDGVFVIGWDGAGNPIGLEIRTGRVLVEDHNFGGIHELAESFRSFLARGFDI